MYLVFSAQAGCAVNHATYTHIVMSVRIVHARNDLRRSTETKPTAAIRLGTIPSTNIAPTSHFGMRLSGYGFDGSPCREFTEKKLMSVHPIACSVVGTL